MSLKTISPATEPDSSVNIIHYMRNNVPFFFVMILAMLNQYAFNDIDCTSGNKAAIIITFILLAILEVLWTVYHCKVDFIINYPHSGDKWVKYANIRSITTLLACFSLNYFIHQGVPFNCFFDYNPLTANIMLYLSFATIAVVSYIEHYYWKKLKIPLIFPEISS